MTENVDLINWTYFCVIRQMSMNDRSQIDKIKATFITLTVTASHHCLSAWNPAECSVLSEFDPGGGAPCTCDSRNVTHKVNNAFTELIRSLNTDLCCFSPYVQPTTMGNICSMNRWRIHVTGTVRAMPIPHNDECSLDVNSLPCMLRKLIE